MTSSILSRIPILSTFVHRACWRILVSTNLVPVWFLYYATGGAPLNAATWHRAKRVAFILDWALRHDRKRDRTVQERKDRLSHCQTFLLD